MSSEPIEGPVAEQARGLRFSAVPSKGFNDAPLEERARLMHAMADAGLDGVIQADHVSFRDGSGVDAIVMMAGLSGLHPTLDLCIGVYLLPLRHPVPVARSLATLAQLAPGRLEFGVGIGGEDRHEVEVCGVDPRTRGRRCDESLVVVRRLLGGESVTHRGEFFDIDDCVIRRPPPRRSRCWSAAAPMRRSGARGGSPTGGSACGARRAGSRPRLRCAPRKPARRVGAT